MASPHAARVATALALTVTELKTVHRLHSSANALAKHHRVVTPAAAFGLGMGQLKALRRVLSGRLDDPELDAAKEAARTILSSEAELRRLQGKTKAQASAPIATAAPRSPKSRSKSRGGRVHQVAQQADPRGRAWLDSILRRLTTGDDSGK